MTIGTRCSACGESWEESGMETHLPDCEVLALQLKNVELEARCAHLAKRCRDFKFSYLVLLVAIALLVATYEYLPAFQ